MVSGRWRHGSERRYRACDESGGSPTSLEPKSWLNTRLKKMPMVARPSQRHTLCYPRRFTQEEEEFFAMHRSARTGRPAEEEF